MGLVGNLTMVTFIVVVCVPASAWMVAVRTRGAVGALVLWWVGSSAGIVGVEGWEGWFGLPPTVGKFVAVFLGAMWAYDFFRLVSVAVGRGLTEARMWSAAKRNIKGF